MQYESRQGRELRRDSQTKSFLKYKANVSLRLAIFVYIHACDTYLLLVYFCLDLSLSYESDATKFPLSCFPVSSSDCEPLLEIWARDGQPSTVPRVRRPTKYYWPWTCFMTVVLVKLLITSLNSFLAAKSSSSRICNLW